MSIDAEPRTISGRTKSEEEGIRLSIYAEIRTSGADPSGFLDILCTAVEREIWTKLRGKDGYPLTFRQFIEAPYPVGVGSTVDAVSKLVRLSHRYEAGSPERAARLATMREKVRGLADGEKEGVARQGEFGGGHGRLDMSSLPPSGQGGNSRDYTLARLKRDRPDLAELVIGGAMSANAAAIEAGFRRRDTPVDTLCRAWGKASDDERAAFLHKIGAR